MQLPTSPRRALLGSAVLLGISTLAACGGDGSGGASQAAVDDADLKVLARDIEFDRDSYSVGGGKDSVAYVQEGAIRHTLLIEGPDGEDVEGFKLEVNGEATDVGDVELEPGSYVFYCDVPGHREAGMEAELVVE